MTNPPPEQGYTDPYTGSVPAAAGQSYAETAPMGESAYPAQPAYPAEPAYAAEPAYTTEYPVTPTYPVEETSPSTADVAKSEAGNVKDTATEAASGVAETAKSEAANVVGETKQQAKGLLDQLRGQLSEQGTAQKQNLSDTLHSLSKELGGMASKSEESGPLTDLAHRASRQGGEIAHWLENHEPKDVLEEVKAFARRRPVAFLFLAGAAGVLAGRVTRGAVAANTSLDSGNSTQTGTVGVLDAGPSYDATQAPVGGYAAVDTGYSTSATTTTGYVDPLYPAAESTLGGQDYPASTGGVPR
jgi:uncharacterized protein YjbJ (UPF0337 family)